MGVWYKNENIINAKQTLNRSIDQLECAVDSTFNVVMGEAANVYLSCCALLNATADTPTSKLETYKRVMRGLKTIGEIGQAKANEIACGDWEIMYALLSLKTSGIVCQSHERSYIDVLLKGHMGEAKRAILRYYDVNKGVSIFDPVDAENFEMVRESRWMF